MKKINSVIGQMILYPRLSYYGLFLSEIEKSLSTKDKRISTAAITTDRSNISKMVINTDFWNRMNDEEKRYIILHEAHHYIKCHYLLDKELGWDRELINIATDLSINSALDQVSTDIDALKQTSNSSLLLTIRRPKNRCMYSEEQLSEMIKSGVKELELKLDELSGVVPTSYPDLNLEELKSSKYYYDKLKEAKEKKADSKEKGEDSKAGEPGNGEGTSGDKAFDEMLESGQGKEMHTTWDKITEGMTDSQKAVLKKQLQHQLDRISKEAGDTPLELKDYVGQNVEVKLPVTSWKQVFKLFTANCISTDLKTNRNRPNRRYGSKFPAVMKKFKTSCITACDASGSMSSSDLNECNSEIYNIYKAGGKVSHFQWDGEATEPEEYKGELTIDRKLAGGTVCDVAIDMINKHASKHTFGVVLTDGYIGSVTVKSKIPVVIIVTSSGSTDFGNPHNYKVIQMEKQ